MIKGSIQEDVTIIYTSKNQLPKCMKQNPAEMKEEIDRRLRHYSYKMLFSCFDLLPHENPLLTSFLFFWFTLIPFHLIIFFLG